MDTHTRPWLTKLEWSLALCMILCTDVVVSTADNPQSTQQLALVTTGLVCVGVTVLVTNLLALEQKAQGEIDRCLELVSCAFKIKPCTIVSITCACSEVGFVWS